MPQAIRKRRPQHWNGDGTCLFGLSFARPNDSCAGRTDFPSPVITNSNRTCSHGRTLVRVDKCQSYMNNRQHLRNVKTAYWHRCLRHDTAAHGKTNERCTSARQGAVCYPRCGLSNRWLPARPGYTGFFSFRHCFFFLFSLSLHI